MRATVGTAGSGNSAVGLAAPSFRSVVARGLPGFLREGFLPLAAFYAGWRLSGTSAGIAAAALVALLLYALRATGRSRRPARPADAPVRRGPVRRRAPHRERDRLPRHPGRRRRGLGPGVPRLGRRRPPARRSARVCVVPVPSGVPSHETVQAGVRVRVGGLGPLPSRPQRRKAPGPPSRRRRQPRPRHVSSRARPRCLGSSPGRSGTRFASSRTTLRTRQRTRHSERRTREPADAHGPLARPPPASCDAVARGGRLAPWRAARHRCRWSHRGAARLKSSAPGRNRTCDLALRRRALYPLSYWRGMRPV